MRFFNDYDTDASGVSVFVHQPTNLYHWTALVLLLIAAGGFVLLQRSTSGRGHFGGHALALFLVVVSIELWGHP